MRDITCKLLVIGAGPGGYVCAVRAAQLGLDTVVVEMAKAGGTCLNVGCIPSKALIHAADEFHRTVAMAAGRNSMGIDTDHPAIDLAKTIAWKDGITGKLNLGVVNLLKKAGVKAVVGRARFRDGKTVAVETETGEQVIRAENVVIATGSAPVEMPALPFGDKVISSTEALSLTELPRRLAIVGAGYIGLELGMAFAKLGAEVTIVEALDRILPLFDPELTRPVARRLAELGVDVQLGAKVKGLSSNGEVLLAETGDGEERRIAANKVLVTVGRRPVTDGWGREELELDMDGRFLKVDDQCRTSMRGIYAIGDVTGEPMLAHRAMAQGEMVAEIVAGRPRAWDKRAIPVVCFTDPEIVSVGPSPLELQTGGPEIKVGQFPFAANARAMTLSSAEGFIRVTARAEDHLVLGMQAVGAGVSELSAAFSLAIEMGARLEDVAATIHAHPTQSEALAEASMKALGQALHL